MSLAACAGEQAGGRALCQPWCDWLCFCRTAVCVGFYLLYGMPASYLRDMQADLPASLDGDKDVAHIGDKDVGHVVDQDVAHMGDVPAPPPEPAVK